MFNRKCSVLGVVHLPPLPGAAGYEGSIDRIMASGLDEAMTYKENGLDGLVLENMHDVPYRKGYVDPETTAAMAIIAQSIKYETQMPVGIQILAGANLEALAAAVAASVNFIRVEGYVYAHVGDEGLHESSAAELIRRRWQLQAEQIKIFADIKKKHSAHAITSDVSLTDTAKAAEFFKADGVIVSGAHTGIAPDLRSVEEVRKAVSCSVLVGSGIDKDNVKSFIPWADALIVGSTFKENGLWSNKVDPERVARFMQSYKQAAALKV